MKLNSLSLRWVSSSVGEGREVEVLVDGVDLISLARDWEVAHTPEPKLAGSYAGIQQWDAQHLQAWRHPSQDLVSVLECECGTWSCWPLHARITREGECVLWSDFEQPHRRGKWSYDGFGPFVFDAELYDTQVKALLEEVQG